VVRYDAGELAKNSEMSTPRDTPGTPPVRQPVSAPPARGPGAGVPNHRPPPPPKPAPRNAVWDVLWAVRRSQRYHARRRAFYRRWRQLTAFAGVMGGSAVVAAAGQVVPGWVALWAAVSVAVLSALVLVVNAADMAHTHDDLRRPFAELEADMVRTAEPSADELGAWTARRLAIEVHEPPIHAALDVLCENELIRATGQHLTDTPLHRLGWFKRATAQVFLWENA